jgi:hypothetical protein
MTQYDALSAAQARYADLAARLNRGEIDQTTFQREQMNCVAQDAQGRSWLPSSSPGQWYLWDGQQWALQAYGPQPAPVAQRGQPQASSQQVVIVQEHRKRGLGCGGCLLVALALLLVVGAAGVWLSPLSVKWGLRKSPTAKLLGAPDRAAADMLRLEMIAGGMPADGVLSYILPIKGQDQKALYTIVDASQGFDLAAAGVISTDALVDLMVRYANSQTVTDEKVGYIAVEYRDLTGATLSVLTAPTDIIRGFANGAVSRDEFMKALDGRVDVQSLFKGGF